MTMYNLWTLIKYEYKKLFQRKAVWIVTLTLMAMAAASVILPPFMSVVSSNNGSDDSYTAYDSYKAQQELAADLKGRPLDDELLGEMNDAYDAERESTERITAFPDSAVPYSAKYDDIDAWIDDAAYESDSPYFSVDENGIPYFTGTAAQLYDIRRANLAKRWEQEYLSDEEKVWQTSGFLCKIVYRSYIFYRRGTPSLPHHSGFLLRNLWNRRIQCTDPAFRY